MQIFLFTSQYLGGGYSEGGVGTFFASSFSCMVFSRASASLRSGARVRPSSGGAWRGAACCRAHSSSGGAPTAPLPSVRHASHRLRSELKQISAFFFNFIRSFQSSFYGINPPPYMDLTKSHLITQSSISGEGGPYRGGFSLQNDYDFKRFKKTLALRPSSYVCIHGGVPMCHAVSCAF